MIIKIIISNRFETFIIVKKQFFKKQFIDSTRKRIFVLLIYDSILKEIVIF